MRALAFGRRKGYRQAVTSVKGLLNLFNLIDEHTLKNVEVKVKGFCFADLLRPQTRSDQSRCG